MGTVPVVGWRLPGEGAPPALSPVDRARAAGLDPARRRAFLTGRALLADLVASIVTDAAPWQVTTGRCRHCGRRHGPVEVEGAPVVVSLAYADRLVVAAAAPSSAVARVGVDAERTPLPPGRASDLARLLGVPSTDVLRRWTRIEAVLKADGRGLRVDPADVRLGEDDRALIAGEPVRYQVRSVAGPGGYDLALAWLPAE